MLYDCGIFICFVGGKTSIQEIILSLDATKIDGIDLSLSELLNVSFNIDCDIGYIKLFTYNIPDKSKDIEIKLNCICEEYTARCNVGYTLSVVRKDDFLKYEAQSGDRNFFDILGGIGVRYAINTDIETAFNSGVLRRKRNIGKWKKMMNI